MDILVRFTPPGLDGETELGCAGNDWHTAFPRKAAYHLIGILNYYRSGTCSSSIRTLGGCVPQHY